MASTPKTSLIGRGIVGGLVPGSGSSTPTGPTTSQLGVGLIGFLVLGMGGGPPPAPAPPVTTTARVTQEVLEVVAEPVLAAARVTQEALEAVLQLEPRVRVTQEALEVVVGAGPPPEEENEWAVEAFPRVRWDGTAERPWDALGEWKVRCGPHIIWGARVVQPAAQWRVRPKPRVIWRTGPGTASTECISADGVMPEPEPPVPTGEQNYVF